MELLTKQLVPDTECKHDPERTISGSKFSNIAAIFTVNILKNRNIALIFF
jgi:hypothetical protein